jgi:7-cyano-7-deazaguanine synthase
VTSVLLLSGGLDSSAVAAWKRPEQCLFVDYGQHPATGEKRSAKVIAEKLGLVFSTIRADCSEVGSGLMIRREQVAAAPSPEWWPFRNQLLLTLAAAHAINRGFDSVMIGTVAEDGPRHSDGTAIFLEAMNALLAIQEGHIAVEAPALGLTTVQLLRTSGISDQMIGWTHSCHLSGRACGGCPGCRKRAEALDTFHS